MDQLGLFGQSPQPDFATAAKLADRLPPWVRFGTSSWTFPGWSGLVYPPDTSEALLRRRGLELYCRYPLFGTVGIDSSYYRPLSKSMLLRYRAQLPEGFRCVSKVFSAVTTLADPRSHQLNPHFLDADYFQREVLGPLNDVFREHAGPLVFEFPPMRHPYWLQPEEFCAQLDRFLARLPAGFQYAVELRNREYLTARYAQTLSRHGVAHTFNLWEQMPDLQEQAQVVDPLTVDFGLVRLLIPPGERYADRRESLAPFDRLVDEQPKMRADVVEMVRRFAEVQRVLFVIVNNKVEGSSPLTVRELSRLVAQSTGTAAMGGGGTGALAVTGAR